MPSDIDNFGNYIPRVSGPVVDYLPTQAVFEAQALAAQGIGTGGGSGGGSGFAGTGSPEGVITANPGADYLDTSTDRFWVKATGTGNTGWRLLIA